ncbi:MAG: prolipoprotein diacylglyceryl transferase [Lawsonibacter sp.]|jgi:phosphatidylglycerol:prolipoprotein diacylglycerol transferase
MTNVVSFPGLGLEFTLNRVAFTVLGRPVYWYGIIIASGLLLAVFLCSRWGKRFGITEDQIIDLMLFAVPAALVAVRVYYVVFNLSLYQNPDGSLNWSAIFRYSDGGLAIYGAILSSAVVLLIFCHVRKISFLAFADLGVHGLFIGQLVGRWGNFMNVEAYGGPTTLPWRMCSASIAEEMLTQGYVDEAGYTSILSGTLGVHPTFFYESAWNFVGLLMVYFLGKKRKFDGECFLFYVFWYGLGRAWIEGMRTDSLYLYVGSSIRVSQLLAAVSAVVAGAVLLWMLRRAKGQTTELYVNRVLTQQPMKSFDKEMTTSEKGDVSAPVEQSDGTAEKEEKGVPDETKEE